MHHTHWHMWQDHLGFDHSINKPLSHPTNLSNQLRAWFCRGQWRLCGAKWDTLGLPVVALRLAPPRPSRRRIMLPSSISFSGSPTILPSLLSRMCNADARGTLWVGRVHETTSIHALLILQTGLESTITSCWLSRAFVMMPGTPPNTSGC